MLFCDLNDREFEITVMKKFNEIQVNSERQLSEFKNKNSQGNKRKMTVTYKKIQLGIIFLSRNLMDKKRVE